MNALYNTTRPSKIKPYAEDIRRLLSEGKTFRQISSYIREKGYKGANSTIRMYATRERKLRKEAGQGNGEKIERRWLIKLLYKPADQVKGISQEQFDQVIARYPVIGKVYDVGKSFKEILFAKKPEVLWSSIFVTHRTNNFVFHTGLQTVSDSHYKNVVLHGCTKYTQILILLDSVHHHYGSNVNL